MISERPCHRRDGRDGGQHCASCSSSACHTSAVPRLSAADCASGTLDSTDVVDGRCCCEAGERRRKPGAVASRRWTSGNGCRRASLPTSLPLIRSHGEASAVFLLALPWQCHASPRPSSLLAVTMKLASDESKRKHWKLENLPFTSRSMHKHIRPQASPSFYSFEDKSPHKKIQIN